MNAPLYTTEILRLAASLGGPRELDRSDGTAELRSPTCGSRMIVSVQLDHDRRVEAITQQVHACAFGQASAALLERHVVGLGHSEISEALVQLSHWLSSDEETSDGCWPDVLALAPARAKRGRHGAILLPFRAVLAAIEAAR